MKFPDPVLVFERAQLRLDISPLPDPAAVDLLCKTLWGSPGGTRYQHLDTRQRITEIPDPSFLHLRKGRDLLGVLSLSRRDIRTPSKLQNSWYIRYFAMKEALQKKSVEADARVEAARDSLLKRSARELFEHPKALGHEKGVFYAYVALDNPRSRAMCDLMGFEPIRTFSTLAFSRIFPRKHPRVRKVSDIETDFVQGRIISQYANHGFFPPDTNFLDDHYRVMTEHSLPVAGLRAIPVNWRIAELPGKKGQWMQKWIPRIPLLNRIYNPERFNFLAIEGMFCAIGFEKHLHDLISHVLAEHGRHAALFWLDENDAFRDRMLKAGSLGLLHRFNTAASVSVVAKGLEEKAWEKARPAYVGARDLV